jgi:NAD+ diphosphatase
VLDLRRGGTDFDDSERHLGGHRHALLNWHDNARFSAVNGAPTKAVKAGWSRSTRSAGTSIPCIDPAVICLVHDGADRVALARQAVWPPRMFSLLAGFVEAGESPSRRASSARSPRRSGFPCATCATWAASRGRSRGR